MPSLPRRPALLLCLAAAGSAACAASGQRREFTSAPPTEAAAYYPLAQGWRWAYDLVQDGDQILATYGVMSNDGQVARVRAGLETLTFGLRPDGITRDDGGQRGDYLLKSPLGPQARWPLRMGEARVVEFGVTVEVPAGRFTNCVVVEETRIDPDRSSRVTYAPGVGPVRIEYHATQAIAGEIRALRSELRGFARPGEDAFGEPQR